MKNVILVGITGHGKTKLFNRLTGGNERVQLGTESITNMIIARLAIRGNFEVLDTPSLGYNEEKLKNFEGIIQPLQQTEIHRIILVIKHDRIVQMIKQIKYMFKYFKNYKEIITIYISYFDLFRGDVNKEKQLIQTRISNEFKTFIYGDLNDASIIQQVNLILQSSQQFPILFCLDEIIECFDVFNQKDCVSIEYLKENLNIQFNIRVYQPIMNFLEIFPIQIADPLYLNYLDILQDFVKLQVEQNFEQFCYKIKNQFQVNTNNTQYKQYQESFFQNSKLSQIISKINENKREHPEIKACPYCGLLQIIKNEQYYNNKILCGENTRNHFSSFQLKSFVQFEYKIENMQVKLIQYDIQLFKDKEELIQKLINSIQDKQFESIIKQFNMKQENQFIQLLQMKFGNHCFNHWIQLVDKRKYNHFIKALAELLLKRMNEPQDSKKADIGCGKYFQKEIYRKRVVLIGTIGFGKTTLFNRLTGAQEKTSQGGESTTRNIILGCSKAPKNDPEQQFEVMDTPGLRNIEDKMDHIAGILAALKQNVVYRIIFTIRHENTDLMVHQIRSMFKFFNNYKENITIYISYFDLFRGDVKKKNNQYKQGFQMSLKQIHSFIMKNNLMQVLYNNSTKYWKQVDQ